MDGAWVPVCRAEELRPDRALLTRVRGHSVALFRTDDELYALSGHDTLCGLDGADPIVQRRAGVPTFISSSRRHVFDLRTGACLEGCAVRLAAVPVRVVSGDVEVAA